MEDTVVGVLGILGKLCTRFVRRFGKHGILLVPGIRRISKLSVFNTDVEFDSPHLPKTEKQAESVARFDVTVLSMSKVAVAAVSFWQWRWYATLYRHIAINFEITPRGPGIALFNRVHMALHGIWFSSDQPERTRRM